MIGRGIALTTLLSAVVALGVLSSSDELSESWLMFVFRVTTLVTLVFLGLFARPCLSHGTKGHSRSRLLRTTSDGGVCTTGVVRPQVLPPTRLPPEAAAVVAESDDGFVSCEEEGEASGLDLRWSEDEWAAEGLAAAPAMVAELKADLAARVSRDAVPAAGCDLEAATGPPASFAEDELRRLLLAAGGGVARAAALWESALEARARSSSFAEGPGREQVAQARRAGLCFRLPEESSDRGGHPVLVFNAGAHDPKRFTPEVVTACMMQLAAEAEASIKQIQRRRRIAKALLIFYMPRGTPWDLGAYSAMIRAVTTAYPEGLRRVLVCPVNGKVAWLYRFVKPFMPAGLREVVTFVAPGKWRQKEFVKEMSVYFDLRMLPETFGGLLPWWPEGISGRKDRWRVATEV